MTTIYEVPRSLRERLATWLAENPGEHTGAHIWNKITQGQSWGDRVSRQRVYNELGRMARAGTVTRRRDYACCGPTLTVYSLADPSPEFPCEA